MKELLRDYNVVTNAVENKYTAASGGAATNYRYAIDYSSSTTYYESELGDSGQYIQVDLGRDHTVLKIVVQWGGAVSSSDPAEQYMVRAGCRGEASRISHQSE